jgi:hypothetical protein
MGTVLGQLSDLNVNGRSAVLNVFGSVCLKEEGENDL